MHIVAFFNYSSIPMKDGEMNVFTREFNIVNLSEQDGIVNENA